MSHLCPRCVAEAFMPAVTDASRWRVLLVEHDAAFAARVVRAFDSPRFGLTVANRLQQALELLRHQSHDLVLLDLGLPESLGSDTIALVTAWAPGVPLTILTAPDDEALEVRARRHGVHDYVVKTEFDARRLIRTARHAIKTSEMAGPLLDRVQFPLEVVAVATNVGFIPIHTASCVSRSLAGIAC